MTSVSLLGLMAYPIHPSGWVRPKDNIDYRVTNPFSGTDFLNGGVHGAVDIGNFRTGDPIRCPLQQTQARALRHTDGALGIEMLLGGVVTLEAWHLSRTSIPATWTAVGRGQLLGVTGNSGALVNGQPMPSHTHIELKQDGLRFDPEPYLLGSPLSVEDDMDLPDGARALISGIVGVGNRLRDDPKTAAGSRIVGIEGDTGIGDPGQPKEVQVLLSDVPGEAYTLGGRLGNLYTMVGAYGRAWYVATPLVTNLRLKGAGTTLVADCSAVENQLARTRTALAGADQALHAALEASK